MAGNIYFLTNPALGQTWTSAQAQAKSRGGNLVTINDAAENNWLKNTFSSHYPYTSVWIGFNDVQTEGQFKWVSGKPQPVTYTNWDVGEPNNLWNEDYGEMYLYNGKWNDRPVFPHPINEVGRGIVEVENKYQFFGTNDDDQLFVRGGAVKIQGKDGDDLIQGDYGNDKLFGNKGDDTLKGGRGNDFLRGDYGNDWLQGDEGNDRLRGGAGNDALFGGNNNDTLYGDAGSDSLNGDAGNDKLYGGAGDDVLVGGKGDDLLAGGNESDTFIYISLIYDGIDTVTDFSTATEVIVIDESEFLGGLPVNPDLFTFENHQLAYDGQVFMILNGVNQFDFDTNFDLR